MISLLQRFAAEKRMQTTNVRINNHLLGESAPASLTTSKSSFINSSYGRETRSVRLGRSASADIHPATVYKSIVPGAFTSDKRRLFREEMERHVQASVLSLGSHMGDECLSKLQGTLNRELEKVETVLQEELETLLNTRAKDLFRKLKSFVITLVDDSCKDKGIQLPQTHLHESEFQDRVGIVRGRGKLKDSGEGKRVYEDLEKMPGNRKPRVSRLETGGGDGLKQEIQDYIAIEIQDVSERLEKVLGQRIVHEVDFKIQQIRETLIKDASVALDSVASSLQTNVENLAKARLAEVLEANEISRRNVESYKVPSGSGKASPVSRLNLEKVKSELPATIKLQIPAHRRLPPDDDVKDSSNEEGLDSSIKAYQRSSGNSEGGRPLTQDDLRVSREDRRGKQQRVVGRGLRKTPPKTKVSESLQRFLENERTLS